jgi:phage terminase small subunit
LLLKTAQQCSVFSFAYFYIERGGVTVRDELNARQRKFAEYYAQSGNAAESAVKAGYSAKYANTNASKLLQNTTIANYIRELSEKLKDERIMTAKDRQVLLSDIARDDENEPNDRIKAVDTLNKMTGEYTVKVDAKVEQSEKLADVFKQLGGEGLDE